MTLLSSKLGGQAREVSRVLFFHGKIYLLFTNATQFFLLQAPLKLGNKKFI